MARLRAQHIGAKSARATSRPKAPDAPHAISTETTQLYTEHLVVHSVISILPNAHRCGHHLEHVLCHDTLVLIIVADISERVERQIVYGGSDLPDIRFQTNI